MIAGEKNRTSGGLSRLGWVEISDGEPKKASRRRGPLRKGLKEVRHEPSRDLGKRVLPGQIAKALSQEYAFSR